MKKNSTRDVDVTSSLLFPYTGIGKSRICLERVQPTKKEVSSWKATTAGYSLYSESTGPVDTITPTGKLHNVG